MDWSAVALADLRVSLEVASKAYARFAGLQHAENARSLFKDLSQERQADSTNIASAIASADLELAEPTLDPSSAEEALHLRIGDGSELTSMAFRVQRSENTLRATASHLFSVIQQRGLRAALGEVRGRIDARREDIRALRRSAAAQAERGAERAGFARGRDADTKGSELTLWFGTNRALDRGNFIGERSDTVRYGRCQVFVPKDRKIGSTGSPWFWRILRGDDRIKLVATNQLSAKRFWADIGQEFLSLEPSERQAFIFLHGYRVKFEEAALRTAQLKADLDFRGPAAFFSWPALGSLAGYAGDRTAIEASEIAIGDFLIDFATRSNAKAVHVIAHSMGNLGLLRAMNAIAQRAAAKSQIRFGQVILAAPDVDRDLFRTLAPAYVAMARRSTLYISENDRAIDMSSRVHRFDRVGLAPPVTIVPGIDTVNVSKINLGFMGHSHTQLRPVLGDIHQLLSANTPPKKRFGLREVVQENQKHWTFV